MERDVLEVRPGAGRPQPERRRSEREGQAQPRGARQERAARDRRGAPRRRLQPEPEHEPRQSHGCRGPDRGSEAEQEPGEGGAHARPQWRRGQRARGCDREQRQEVALEALGGSEIRYQRPKPSAAPSAVLPPNGRSQSQGEERAEQGEDGGGDALAHRAAPRAGLGQAASC